MDSDIEEDLSVGVAEYLKEWGLSDETISNFEDNHITLKLLDDIQETELKELIPSLKDRILFKRGLKKLRNIIQYGLYTHPVFSKQGGWPPGIEELMAKNSRLQGYPRSRLPAFTDEEKELAKGAYDFFGFNYYTSRRIRTRKDGENIDTLSPLSYISELDAILEVDPGWEAGACYWFFSWPEGLRKQLGWVKAQYGHVDIIITENGYPSRGYGLRDYERIKYYRDHLEQVLLSIHKDKVNVTGYTAWSLIDNFEWNDGYMSKFGLYEVNFEDPKRARTPRDSAKYYKEVIKTNNIDIPKKYIRITDEL